MAKGGAPGFTLVFFLTTRHYELIFERRVVFGLIEYGAYHLDLGMMDVSFTLNEALIFLYRSYVHFKENRTYQDVYCIEVSQSEQLQ